jgi:anti-sigma factor RsiW
MSIRLLARDLYGAQLAVERLERALLEAPVERRPELEERLRRARAERDRLRHMLEGQKDAPAPPGRGRR